MFKGFLSGVKKIVTGAKSFVASAVVVGVVVGGLSLVPDVAFAQTPEPVTFTELVKFDGTGGILESVKGPLAKILAGAIGIGLAVWAARFFFGVVKSMGRG
jgi:hypothetical protein